MPKQLTKVLNLLTCLCIDYRENETLSKNYFSNMT